MKHGLVGSLGMALALVAAPGKAEPLVVDHGRLFLQVAVNGAATEALLDSGAEATVVDDQFASQLNLANGASQPIRGSGGSAPATVVEGVTLTALGADMHPKGVIVTDLDELSARLIQRPTRVIIGRDLFDAARLLIDIPAQRIEAVPKTYKALGVPLPLTEHAGLEAVPARANGVASQAELDFGNGNEVLISRALAQRLQLQTVGRKDGGGIGGKLERDLVTIGSLEVAGVEFRNVTAAVDDQPTANDLNIGTAILGRFRILTDFPARTVWFERLADQMGAAQGARSTGGASGEHVVCELRTEVGSHLRKRVCRTREQLEQERSDAEETMRTMPKSRR
jgi:predicted aspartyl protease